MPGVDSVSMASDDMASLLNDALVNALSDKAETVSKRKEKAWGDDAVNAMVVHYDRDINIIKQLMPHFLMELVENEKVKYDIKVGDLVWVKDIASPSSKVTYIVVEVCSETKTNWVVGNSKSKCTQFKVPKADPFGKIPGTRKHRLWTTN